MVLFQTCSAAWVAAPAGAPRRSGCFEHRGNRNAAPRIKPWVAASSTSSSSSGGGCGPLGATANSSNPSSSTAGSGLPAFVKPAGMANNILELNEHRRGVGLCIYRPSDGLVFAARRVDDPQRSWQMPQGGIDPLENPMRAALRELHEETAVTSVRIVASIDHWLTYSFPTSVRHGADGSVIKYRGQTQKWFLLEFFGDDSEVDLESCIGFPEGHGHHTHAEFSEWSWQPLESLPAGVVAFKQGVYQQVARHFGPEIRRRVGAAAAAL